MQKQMAHIVAVPRREPCKECGNPVFFAERLTIGNAVYHRTCLRCARCNSQLTPGSFYETEIDGVFCCETCPDEEKKIQITPSESVANGNGQSDGAFTSADPHRQSFSDKLAMFQSNGKGLLQKSMSDEEKSKSLKRLTELYAHNANGKSHSETDLNASTNNLNDDCDSSGSDSSDSENEEVPPTLPKIEPPSRTTAPIANIANESASPLKSKPPTPSKANVLNKIYGNADNKPFANKLKPPAANIDLTSATSTNEPSIDINMKSSSSQNEPLIEKTNNGNAFNTSNTLSHQATVNDLDLNSRKSDTSLNHKSFENNLNVVEHMSSNALNDFTNVTKENDENNAIVDCDKTSTMANDHNNDTHCMDNFNEYDRNSDASNKDQNSHHTEEFHHQCNDDDNNDVELRSHSQINALECEQNEQDKQQQQQQQQQQQLDEQHKSIISSSSDSSHCNEDKSIDTNIDKQNSIKIDNNNADLSDRNSSISNNINSNNSMNMVRSRLSQFEALLQSDTRQTTHRCSDSPKLTSRKTVDIENISKQMEQNVAISGKTVTFDETQNVELTQPTPTQSNEIDRNDLHESSLNSKQQEENETLIYSKTIHNSTDPTLNETKPIPLKRISKIVHANDEIVSQSKPPTPLKRKQRNVTSEDNSMDLTQTLESHLIENANVPDSVEEPVVANENCENGKKENGNDKNYPVDLNPFGSDDEEDDNEANEIIQLRNTNLATNRKDNSNPFDSSDDEVELLKDSKPRKLPSNFRVSTNPFGSDTEDENDTDSASLKRTPVPTPRKPINGASFQTTPEPSPRMSYTLHPKMRLSMNKHSNDEFYGSDASLASSSNYARPYDTMQKNYRIHGSMTSLASTPRHKKGRAPAIPTTAFSSAESSPLKISLSANSSPSHSVRATPQSRKKRAAPLPPSAFKQTNLFKVIDNIDAKQAADESFEFDSSINTLDTSIESSYASTAPSTCEFPIQNKISDIHSTIERKSSSNLENSLDDLNESTAVEPGSHRKRIPIDISLLDDLPPKSIAEMTSEENMVVYRRTIVPTDTSSTTQQPGEKSTNDRQWEKMKENKESQNKNRQSQILITMPATITIDDTNPLYSVNKSSYGKWKRRKGAAPPLPIPPRKVIQMLPLQEIRHELEVIEVQQQGLEKQGVMLEKMIRERCEGDEHENTPVTEFKPNSKEVEDLILQLFELVNEKNELFRRQAELMYLRRQHRLEQEQADIEYEIRVLMAQPECNKTDSDKTREEGLISRLVEVVQLRNDVIESLEMDRLREAEEDQSIKERLELHTANRDKELCQQTPIKLSKKEKKKQKESKKLAKQKKMDADKDADESEINQLDKTKEKKKKKKFLF